LQLYGVGKVKALDAKMVTRGGRGMGCEEGEEGAYSPYRHAVFCGRSR
jgi:hypothetical protein